MNVKTKFRSGKRFLYGLFLLTVTVFSACSSNSKKEKSKIHLEGNHIDYDLDEIKSKILEIEKVHCIRQMINEYGMNFAGLKRMLALLPCWKIRGCKGNDRGSRKTTC